MWLRKQMLVMSQNTYTSLTFWRECSLVEFKQWIHASNELHDELNKK